ncbi:MAG: molybdenum cofactor guanylyltransferase [Desulfobulbaceae bacterium]|nr:molybdenum cofactor guanylyltransferase [Desulfobulbaceae bacterium]
METIQDITGVVLAGGQSKRFGSNKALALLQGMPLIQHVADTASAIFKDCLLVTNTPEHYGFLNMPMIRDQYQGMGPLAGIHAALLHTGKPWIFVIGCDMPAVTPDLITFLCGFAREEYDAVIPWLETGAEPLCGLYHKTALDKIEPQLRNNKRQVKELLEKLSVRKVTEEELQSVTGGLQVFSNVNREQDLVRVPRAK